MKKVLCKFFQTALKIFLHSNSNFNILNPDYKMFSLFNINRNYLQLQKEYRLNPENYVRN